MDNVISFSSYVDEYLYYVKTTKIKRKVHKFVVRINKKLVSPYNIELVRRKFNPLDFDLVTLVKYLIENNIRFRIFLPLKHTRGFYKKHYPNTVFGLDHYNFQDDKDPMEKRNKKDFEYIDWEVNE